MSHTHKSLLGAIALALIIPVFLVVTVPPFMNYIDTCVMFQSQFSFNFPHWKPISMLYLRFVNGLVAGGGAGNILEIHSVHPVSLLVIVAFQHIAMVAAEVYFAWTVLKCTKARIALVVLLSVFPPISLHAHTVGLEGYVAPAVLVMAAITFTLCRQDGRTRKNLMLLTAVCFTASFIRHDLAVLFSLGPLAVLFSTLVQGHGVKVAAKGFGLALLIVTVGFVSVSIVERIYLSIAGIQVTSNIGRLGAGWLQSNAEPMLDASALKSLENEVCGCVKGVKNPRLYVHRLMYPEVDAYDEIQEIYVREHPIMLYVNQREGNDKTDLLLNEIVRCYVLTNPGRFVVQAWGRVGSFANLTLGQKHQVGNSKGFAQIAGRYPVTIGLVGPRGFLSFDGREYDKIAANPLFSIFDAVSVPMLAALALGSLLVVSVVRRPMAERLVPLWVFLFSGSLHLTVMGAMAGGIFRYAIVFGVLFWIVLIMPVLLLLDEHLARKTRG